MPGFLAKASTEAKRETGIFYPGIGESMHRKTSFYLAIEYIPSLIKQPTTLFIRIGEIHW